MYKLLSLTILIALLSVSSFNADNSIDDDKENDFDTWEAPREIRKNYPYYKAGYDDEGRPIWVIEFGKWNLKKLVEQGENTTTIFDKYCDQWTYRVHKSLGDKSTPDNPVTGWVFIFDFEDYDLVQLGSVRTLAYTLKKVQVVERTCRTMDYGFVINMNFVAETLLNAARPLLGNSLERAEIFGVNKAKWLPSILKRINKDVLPEWYGGSKNFTPVAVYG